MAKYELSDAQVKQLMTIIANATVRGSDAPAILQLSRALQTPIKEVKKDEKKEVK